MGDMLAQRCHGDAGANDYAVDIAIGQMVRRHDYPIHWATDDRFAKEMFALAGMIRIRHHHIILMRARHILHGAHQRMINRIGNVGDHHCDHARLLAAQTARMQIRIIAKLLDGIQDTLARLFPNGDAIGSII
jgi:hypothetical protein